MDSFDLYLLPGGEDRSARLIAEADAERLAASVRPVRRHRRPNWLARLAGRGRTAPARRGGLPAQS